VRLAVVPHNDDETLWLSWTILREQPLVLVVFDGCVQGNRGVDVTALQRRCETQAAMKILGVQVEFLGFRDDDPAVTVEQVRWRIGNANAVYAPAFEVDGHVQHNLVATACDGMPVVDRYLTYTRTKGEKSRSSREVKIDHASWIGKKLRALACYESQHSLDPRMGCWPHFCRDLSEFYAE
jgi:LmbE family N-acetylglucosaminyl deacetylase